MEQGPLLLVFSFHARADTGGDRPKSIPELQAAVEKVLKGTKTPAAGIAIVSRDAAEWVAGIGKADVAAGMPATADTLFRLGSLSKTFVAVAALQLQCWAEHPGDWTLLSQPENTRF